MIDGLIVNAVVVPEIILHPETQVVPRLSITAQTGTWQEVELDLDFSPMPLEICLSTSTWKPASTLLLIRFVDTNARHEAFDSMIMCEHQKHWSPLSPEPLSSSIPSI